MTITTTTATRERETLADLLLDQADIITVEDVAGLEALRGLGLTLLDVEGDSSGVGQAVVDRAHYAPYFVLDPEALGTFELAGVIKVGDRVRVIEGREVDSWLPAGTEFITTKVDQDGFLYGISLDPEVENSGGWFTWRFEKVTPKFEVGDVVRIATTSVVGTEKWLGFEAVVIDPSGSSFGTQPDMTYLTPNNAPRPDTHDHTSFYWATVELAKVPAPQPVQVESFEAIEFPAISYEAVELLGDLSIVAFYDGTQGFYTVTKVGGQWMRQNTCMARETVDETRRLKDRAASGRLVLVHDRTGALV